MREWYMHPNGQIPACEYNFSDVNPPVQAWAAWRIYKIAAARGGRDRQFLARVFQKQLLNFNWWVNRKDVQGKHIFAGGFLGLDNIGVFDRSQPLPDGVYLGTSRRHRLDGDVLHDDAGHGPGAGPRRSGLRRHRLELFRTFRGHRRRPERPGRNRLVGRAGRLLLRPPSRRRPVDSAAACGRWSDSCRCWRSK